MIFFYYSIGMKRDKSLPGKYQELLESAVEQAEFSYSPYSKFRVGAALLCEDGTVFTGTNVENRSYGATICAEQVAVTSAVSKGKTSFEAIAIVGLDSNEPLSPCGICRQVLTEFSPGMIVIMSSGDGTFSTCSLDELFPKDLLRDLKGSTGS
jgi:cytidine deaminase